MKTLIWSDRVCPGQSGTLGEIDKVARLGTITQMISHQGLSLSVGAKETRLADVNVDLSPYKGLDVMCTVTHLPFRNEVFQEVLFTDVIEHLRTYEVESSLSELRRVLHQSGRLIVTTPNDRLLYKILDPAWILFHHRHYTQVVLEKMLERNGLIPEHEGTFGSAIEALILLVMYATYPFKRATGSYPNKFFELDMKPTRIRPDQRGFTRFVVARRGALYNDTESQFATRPTPILNLDTARPETLRLGS